MNTTGLLFDVEGAVSARPAQSVPTPMVPASEHDVTPAARAAPAGQRLTIDPDATRVTVYGPGKEGSTFVRTGQTSLSPLVGVWTTPTPDGEHVYIGTTTPRSTDHRTTSSPTNKTSTTP